MSGSTRDKAVRFFLGALEYLEIPVSPLFKRSSGNGAAIQRKRRGAGRPKGAPEIGEVIQHDTGSARPAGTSRVVKLKSGGGTLTVSVSLDDPFALSDEDQKFVFELINRLRDYEIVLKEGGERG